MHSSAIRTAFLDFFARAGHTVVESSPVVPRNDPTLLFANAGMNQFKQVFIGMDKRPYTRATSSQKCIRAGGKHNDLDNVGKTPRHHTFFEMLGNFSFGDYFKQEAIAFAWELLTRVYGLPKEHLWVSVFEKDDEAEKIWKQHVAARRIVRLGKKDNFWEMGETGPCGPCTEIHIDLRSFYGGQKPDDLEFHDTWTLELWNLVFMQFNRREDGAMDPLPKPSVDTGAGLERLAAVLQGKHSNYESDVFSPLIEKIEKLSGAQYTPLEMFGPRPMTEAEIEAGMPHRVIADHIRAVAFAIADGAVPSNEGRGYVLRRILRRAVRYGRRIGIEKPFLAELLPILAHQFGTVHPGVKERADHIATMVRTEEERFAATLATGIALFSNLVEKRMSGTNIVPGEEAFKLYDTYGFPIDITQDMAREIGWEVDTPGFERHLREQRERAKAARSVAGPQLLKVYEELYRELGDMTFVGYESLSAEATVRALVDAEGNRCTELAAGTDGWVVFDRTPFYGESGGQVGDTGTLQMTGNKLQVAGVIRPAHNLFAHHVVETPAPLRVGDTGVLEVQRASREAIMRHHTATHLLHAALHVVVGKHATQSGSAVAPERLRFDFHHHAALTEEQKLQIERRVNEVIVRDLPVKTEVTTVDEAKKTGAMMLFDEKYGDHVRLVSVGDVSRELCGGTHAPSTGFIGSFYIVGESAVAAGVRRIEAVCGLAALDEVQRQRQILRDLAHRLNVKDEEIVVRIDKMGEEIKALGKKLKDARSSGSTDVAAKALQNAKDIRGTKVVVANLGDMEAKDVLAIGDQIKAKLTSYVVVLGATTEGKCVFVAQVSEDQVKAGRHAGNLVKELAKITGGGGGGKPSSAQAGGKDPGKLDEALAAVEALIA